MTIVSLGVLRAEGAEGRRQEPLDEHRRGGPEEARGGAILYTATAQKRLCTEPLGLILAHSRSRRLRPGVCRISLPIS